MAIRSDVRQLGGGESHRVPKFVKSEVWMPVKATRLKCFKWPNKGGGERILREDKWA